MSEEQFKQTLCGVFDHYDIEYETEKRLEKRALPESHTHGSRIDVYVPATDTAIELKASGDQVRGVGQALNYTRFHKEAILMVDDEVGDYRPDAHRTAAIAPGVHYALVIPNANPSGSRAGLDVKNSSRPELFYEMAWNVEWDDRSIVLKALEPRQEAEPNGVESVPQSSLQSFGERYDDSFIR